MAQISSSTVFGDLIVTRKVKGHIIENLDGTSVSYEGHAHDASDINSGTLSVDRLPAEALIGDTVYTHPSDGGGSRSNLSGTAVISGITVNGLGHVTATTVRDVSKSDIGLGSVDNYSRSHYDDRYLRKQARNSIAVESSTAEALLNLNASNNAGSGATLLEGSIESNTTDRYFMTFKGTSNAVNWQVSTDGVLRAGDIPWARLSGQPATATSWPTWDQVSSKPSTFAPDSHDHTLENITDSGDLAAINTNASTSNYLRGDGTWVTPPNTTYSAMSIGEGQTGTATSSRVMRADHLKAIIQHHASELVSGAVIKRQEFVATANQTVFNLTNGSYSPNESKISVFVWGVKQNSNAYTETATSFTFASGVPAGTRVLAEWFELDPILKGDKGDKGDTGDTGDKGDKPNHGWSGTSLRFENVNGTWGSYVNLKGDKGDPGDNTTATNVSYNNSGTGLSATNVQAAINEVVASTTYSVISEAEVNAGTATTARTISGQRAKYIMDNTDRYHVGTSAPTNTKLLWIDTTT